MRTLLAILTVATLPLLAVESASVRLEKELEAANEALIKTNRQISEEKQALLKQMDDLDRRTAQQKRVASSLQEKFNSIRLEADAAAGQLRQIQEAQRQMSQQLDDFQTELLLWKTPGAPALDIEKASSLSTLLPALCRNLEERIGGTESQGSILTSDGKLEEATLLRMGPVLYALQEKNASMLVIQPQSPLPRMADNLSRKEISQIRNLISENSDPVCVPMDVTGGDALAIHAESDTFLEHLIKGGPTMVPILLLGFFCILLGVRKILQLIHIPAFQPSLQRAAAALEKGDIDLEESECQHIPLPIRRLVKTCILHFSQDKDSLEETLFVATQDILSAYSKHLSLLAVSASAAPLLGLLGTVTGMIHTFRLITLFGTGDAHLLSAGISEALITTEAGLTVAIPAMLLYAWCRQRCRRIQALLEESARQLLQAKEAADREGKK